MLIDVTGRFAADLGPAESAFSRTSLAALMHEGDANLPGTAHGVVARQFVETTAARGRSGAVGGRGARHPPVMFADVRFVRQLLRNFLAHSYGGNQPLSLVVVGPGSGTDLAGINAVADPESGDLAVATTLRADRSNPVAVQAGPGMGSWPQWDDSKFGSFDLNVFVDGKFWGDAIVQTYRRKCQDVGTEAKDSWQVARMMLGRPSGTVRVSGVDIPVTVFPYMTWYEFVRFSLGSDGSNSVKCAFDDPGWDDDAWADYYDCKL